MANEAVCIEKSVMNDVMRTCADAVGIEKGSLMILSDPNTVSGSLATTASAVFGGITTSEKVASDGSTRIACAMNGVYDIKAVTAITAGRFVAISGANLIREATPADISGGNIVGKAEETATADEVIRVRLLGY
jgi:hypothetical protein